MNSRSFRVLLGTMVGALSGGHAALGQIWFADDFDSYGSCISFPCNCAPDQSLFQNSNWDPGPGAGFGSISSVHTGTCPSGFEGWDEPFSWRINKSASQQVVRSLIPEIQAASGNPTRNAVNGTDANPLVVLYHMYLTPDSGKPAFTSFWFQLFAGPAEAMLAPIRAPGVGACTNGVCVGGPMDGRVCTTDDTCTAMKLVRTGAVNQCSTTLQNFTPAVPRPALAVGPYGGENGLIPKPPCTDLINNELSRLVAYNGERWWQLKSDSPPGSGGSGLSPRSRNNTIVLTIRSNTFDIQHSYALTAPVACTGNVCVGGGPYDGQPCTSNGQCRNVTETKTNVPRQYTGPFQSVGMGPGPISDGTSQEFPVGSQYPANFDDIEISGGEFSTLPTGACCQPGSGTCLEGTIEAACVWQGGQYVGDGLTCAQATCIQGACCLPSGTCLDDIDPADCSSQGGTFNGALSTCAASPVCCPHGAYVWADHDADGDVDGDDFGDFQKCYTGTNPPGPVSGDCKCYDRDSDGNVDQDDFTAFNNCVSGPSVPWNPGNLPNCQP